MVTGRAPVLWAGAALALFAGAACTDLSRADGGSAENNEGPPQLLILVYDRSTSVTEHQLEHAQELASERIGELDHGDRIVAIELLRQSLAEEPDRWSQRVPEREYQNRDMVRDSVTRTRFLRDVQDYLARFADPEDRDDIDGTDILSTMHLVEEEIRAYPDHEPTLVLFSDMLQANRVMNMEGLVRMPSDNWVQTQASRGTLPDLSGLCVVVVGARKDTRASQIVRTFWTDYFEVTGADLREDNYTHRPVRLPHGPCPGG